MENGATQKMQSKGTQKIFEKNLKIYYICHEKKSLKFKKIYSFWKKNLFICANKNVQKVFKFFIH